MTLRAPGYKRRGKACIGISGPAPRLRHDDHCRTSKAHREQQLRLVGRQPHRRQRRRLRGHRGIDAIRIYIAWIIPPAAADTAPGPARQGAHGVGPREAIRRPRWNRRVGARAADARRSACRTPLAAPPWACAAGWAPPPRELPLGPTPAASPSTPSARCAAHAPAAPCTPAAGFRQHQIRCICIHHTQSK